jgi:pyruvate formate lyase activating enzyme
MSSAALANTANEQTYCVCFFGGDPASQMPHALDAGRRLAERGTVVCWETAGTSHPRLLDRAVDLSLATGGCVKFDLKAYGEGLHMALTGASNRRTLDNFERAASRAAGRRHPPLVIASTLLVPGYVDAREVRRIARFIARIDPDTPYALLAFAPHFFMDDLPTTSRSHALRCKEAAEAVGLKTVRIGNLHLLSEDY